MGSSALSLIPRLSLSTILVSNQEILSVSALVDSGAEQNLISQDFVDQMTIPRWTLKSPLTMTGLTGQSLARI